MGVPENKRKDVKGVKDAHDVAVLGEAEDMRLDYVFDDEPLNHIEEIIVRVLGEGPEKEGGEILVSDILPAYYDYLDQNWESRKIDYLELEKAWVSLQGELADSSVTDGSKFGRLASFLLRAIHARLGTDSDRPTPGALGFQAIDATFRAMRPETQTKLRFTQTDLALMWAGELPGMNWRGPVGETLAQSVPALPARRSPSDYEALAFENFAVRQAVCREERVWLWGDFRMFRGDGTPELTGSAVVMIDPASPHERHYVRRSAVTGSDAASRATLRSAAIHPSAYRLLGGLSR